jgi:hypothetical protein
MDPNDPSPRKIAIVEWTAAIFGIPWSIWWGFFINEWLKSEVVVAGYFMNIELTRDLVMILSVVVISIFILVYVRWLWKLTSWGRRTTIVRLRDGGPVVLLTIALSLAIIWINWRFDLAADGIPYGVALTIAWVVVPAIEAILY